ncbi:DnaJ domain-containing protein [Anaeromyxobacter oryzae]|uniref:J domain-containing protein n=1 Tax=Anaeromyxobacter oryzae TaxID=2918170 RepID=A0ABN6MVU5_9BACT|nr:DnaJ domain-containing protein [Anaeromyxobacter oryzae]BDG03843.1 hypothetical protein AMOR_28390 [Anaeromyxobacter oryzae]
MSDSAGKPPAPTPPRPRPAAAPAAPPKLDRVPEGYRPPAQVRPPPEPRPPPPPAAPVASYGMAARQVGADAAIAAGLSLQGRLETDSALRLFGLAAATVASGRLTVAPEGRSYALVFKKGAVVHVASSDPAEDLGRFLVRKGVLTPEKLVQAEGARPAAGGDLAGALIAAGLVPPGDVAGLLHEHRAALVARALAAEAGAFSWEPGIPPPPSGFSLGAPFAALGAAVRSLDVGAVKRRLGEREARAISRVAGRVLIEDLRLTPQEARAAALFDGARSPAEIATGHPAEAATILRVALLLAELDLAAFGAVRKGVAPPPAAAMPPPPTAPSGPPPPAAPAAAPAKAAAHAAEPAPPRPAVASAPTSAATPAPRPAVTPAPPRPAVTPAPRPTVTPAPRPATPPSLDPAALQAMIAKLAGKDHFEVLGVKRDTQPAQVKIAYFQLAKLYHPDAVPGTASPEVRNLCADVFARVSDAWSVLSDDGRRAAYVQELASGGAANVDVMNILHAENVFQTATLLVKGRRYEEARAKLEEALKLNPDEAEFGIWLAWCHFLLASDKKRQHAESAAAIEAALRKNMMCVPGYLFLAQMAKLAGDAAGAERHLRRGLHVAPDHAELLRELKYLKK